MSYRAKIPGCLDACPTRWVAGYVMIITSYVINSVQLVDEPGDLVTRQMTRGV
jgi:hypothetical protein